MKRLTLWRLATGIVAASLMVTSLASAVQLAGWPGDWNRPSCPKHSPVVGLVGCEGGALIVPPGVTGFFFVIENRGEVQPPGCPQFVQSGVVSANIFGRRRSGRQVLVATVQGSSYINHLYPGQSRTFKIKWLHRRSRSGDEGILRFGGLSCRLLVQ